MGRSVIYAVSHLPEWVDVAQLNKKNLDWNPTYWITNSVTDPLVSEAFPDTIRHSYQEILSFKSPPGKDFFNGFAIDESVIQQYALYERLALKMIDRFIDSADMSYNDRKHFYYQLLIYSENVIRETKADVIVFTEIPHHVAQYVLYAVAREAGVDMAMFGYLPFYQERFVMLRHIEDHPLNNQEIMDDGTFGDEVSGMINDYLATVTGEREKAVMPHMVKQKRTSGLWHIGSSFVKRSIGKLSLKQGKSSSLDMLKSKEGLIRLLPLSYGKSSILKLKGIVHKKKLKKVYEQLAQDVDLDDHYVYVPLHYQPERTTNPDGGVFSDQWLMLNLISKSLPESWQIYVKEHPTQFHPRYEGHLGRDVSDYHRILALKGVKLASITTDSLLLADKSRAVLSVNSSVTFEAFFRRKPALVFAKNNWLINWDGVFLATDSQSLESIFKRIQDGIEYRENSSFELMKTLHKSTMEIRLLPEHNPWMSGEENASRLHSIFVNLNEQIIKEANTKKI